MVTKALIRSLARRRVKSLIVSASNSLKLSDETRLTGRDMALEGNPSDDDTAFAPIDYLADSRYEQHAFSKPGSHARLPGEGLSETTGDARPAQPSHH